MRSRIPAALFGMLALMMAPACSRMDIFAVTTDAATDRVSVGPESGRDSAPDLSSAAKPSAGCGKTPAITFLAVPNQDPNAPQGSGLTVGHGQGGYVKIQSSGKTRAFTMRIPDNYDPNLPYWLIFTFHIGNGNAWGVDNGGSNGYPMAYYGLQMLSKNNAFFVAPEGLNAVWSNSNGEDVKLVDDMVQSIEDNYCVDTTHLFAQGVSSGGSLAYTLACDRANVFRGVAIYEGSVSTGCENGNDPIAYWQMVGLTDTYFKIDTARPMRDRFAKNNGCAIPDTEPPQPLQPPPYSLTAGHMCTDYDGCSSGHPLRWCVHQSGLGNAVVDGTDDLYNSCQTPPNTCSDTCKCTWVPKDVWEWMTKNF